MSKKILAIGAHFDDIEIGIGGTLLKHIENNDDVYLAITSSDEHRTGNCCLRREEQEKSLKLLNIHNDNLYMFSLSDNISIIVGVLDKIHPTTIYTMYEYDTHQDHRRASVIGQAVGRKVTTQVIFYNSGTSYDFTPNLFSLIDFKKKQEIISCFKTQISLNAININSIKKREAYWASLITDKNLYAEGLVIRKMLYKIGE